MPRRILKYPLPTPTTAIPFGPDDRVLTVATQHGVPTLWVEHGPGPFGEERTIVGRPTGDEVQDGEVYLGTAHDVQGGLVFHLYMTPEGDQPPAEPSLLDHLAGAIERARAAGREG